MYSTYQFYTETYGGKAIPEDKYSLFAGIARAHISAQTRGKATSDSDDVKLCECAIADILYDSGTVGGESQKNPTSESIGGYSVAYRGAVSQSDLDSQIRRVIYDYLANTGLLYKGL